MSRYLQRLSRRAMGKPLEAPLSPAIRVWSPVEESPDGPAPMAQQQAPGVPSPVEFSPAQASDPLASPPHSRAGQPRREPDDNDIRSGASQLLPPVADPRRVATPPPATPRSPGADAGIEPPRRAMDRQPVPPAVDTPHPVTRPAPASESGPPPVRARRPDAHSATTPASGRKRISPTQSVPSPMRPAAPANPTVHTVVREAGEARETAPLEPRSRTGRGETGPTPRPLAPEPKPKRQPPQAPLLEPPGTPPRQAPSPVKQAPRLEIGHLHVEVVQAPPEPTPPRPQKRPGRGAGQSSQPRHDGPGSKLRFGLGGL